MYVIRYVCRVCGERVRVKELRDHLEGHHAGARSLSLVEVMNQYSRKEEEDHEQGSDRIQACEVC